MFLCVFLIVDNSLLFNAKLYVSLDKTFNGSSFVMYIDNSYSIVLSMSFTTSRKYIYSGKEITLKEKIYLLSTLKYL